jgi:transcriptional regulator with XRE-family HTH domain
LRSDLSLFTYLVALAHLMRQYHLMLGASDVLTGFRERLREVLDTAGRSQSAFAADIGIDRSTLSQLLSAQNRRLPRAETLIAISRAAGVSADWLLGLSNEGPIRADILHEVLAVSRTELSPLDEALIGWFQESIGSKVRYVPATLPRSEERRVGKECRSRWSPYH